MGALPLERVLVRALVWCLGRGMAKGIGRIMEVVTVEVGKIGTWMREVESSLSSDSWMMSLSLLVGFVFGLVRKTVVFFS